MNNSGKDPVISRVKEYITPGLITILGILLWAEISELKRDVKTLLANDASTQTKVDMLEKEIDRVRQSVCNTYKNTSYGGNEPSSLPTRGVAKKEDDPEVPTSEDSMA
jgi:FtsZ-binding cell division protein ZapB